MSDATVICLRGATWRLYPCKLWTGRIGHNGYGQRYVRGSNPKRYAPVHREALAQRLGRPILEGMNALHHCDVPNCYQAEHIYEGTHADNARDRDERGRARPFGHKQVTSAMKADLKRRYAAGETQKDLAAEYGIDRTTVWLAVDSGRHYSVVTDAMKEEIRARYVAGITKGLKQTDLMREYGLGSGTIARIVKGVREEMYDQILRRYAAGGITKNRLAAEFGVQWTTVDQIVSKAAGG